MMMSHNIGNKIIFLDFDGVLHPVESIGKEYFSRMHLIENFLRANRDIQIVVSSSWREACSLEKMQSFFEDDVFERVIDITPINVICPQNKFWRQVEIEAWIQKNEYTGHWVAVDDAKSEFEDGFRNLIWCQPRKGITEREVMQLQDFFRFLG